MKIIQGRLIVFLVASALLLPAASWAQNQNAPNKPRNGKTGASNAATVKAATNPTVDNQTANGKNGNGEGIRLNFRGVTLDTVLDYLSQTAGFVVVKEAQLDGTVDVFSHQPLTKDEAVALLNTVLHEKGFAAVRNERTLTIVKRTDAKLKDLRVQTGSDPEKIPKTDEMITQVVPVLHTDATKLVENLQPLVDSSYATLSANESSNAVIITDTQKNIRRLTEIIESLDSSISSISTVRVFNMKSADAKQVATIITEVFRVDTTSGNQRRGGMNFPMPPFMDRGGRGGGDQGSQSGTGQSEARNAASKVVAVADERTNSVVVTAPEELMPVIDKLMVDIDQVTEDQTEIWVFQLKYADATEMETILTNLFPQTSTTTSGQSQFAPRFGMGGMMGGPGGMMGGPGGMGGMGRGGSSSQTGVSQRQLQQTTVRAVADPRTNSIIVYAASETMAQIKQMIEQLDARQDKRQQVFVYKLEHADVENVATILRNIFETNNYNTSNRQSNTNTNQNTLSNRTVQSNTSLNSSRGGNTGGTGN